MLESAALHKILRGGFAGLCLSFLVASMQMMPSVAEDGSPTGVESDQCDFLRDQGAERIQLSPEQPPKLEMTSFVL